MADPHDRVLLAPGHEAEWAKINEEEASQEAELLSGPDHLLVGQATRR